MRKGNRKTADAAGTHLLVLKARTKCIKKIIKELGLNTESPPEQYIAKKVAVQYFGFPWIDYPKGWKLTGKWEEDNE